VRLIETLADVQDGMDWLAGHDPVMARLAGTVGLPPLRRHPPGFAALLDAIVGQQVSVASAAAIRRRLAEAGLIEAGAAARASEEDLRAAGLSRPKARHVSALANSGFDYAALSTLPVAEAVARLVELPGIGRWSAEIYAMMALGHADVIAAGDLALQEAARMAYGLSARPGEADLRRMAEAWSPWRGVAARLLWAYYRLEKQREGIR
jgi:DNA-3-methyladenine glycosylase II